MFLSCVWQLNRFYKWQGSSSCELANKTIFSWERPVRRADWAIWQLNSFIKWQGSSVGESARLIPVRSRVRISPLLFFIVYGALSAAHGYSFSSWPLVKLAHWGNFYSAESVRSRVRISPLLFFITYGALSACCNLTTGLICTDTLIILA